MRHIFFIVLIAISLCGCSALKIPDAHTSVISSGYVLPGSVEIINTSESERGNQWLVDALMELSFSKSISTNPQKNEADYTLKLTRPSIGKCFSEPMLSAMTLFIVPHFGCAEVGYMIEFTDNKNKASQTINSSSELKYIQSLFIAPLYFHPNWIAGGKSLVKYEAQLIVNNIRKIAGP